MELETILLIVKALNGAGIGAYYRNLRCGIRSVLNQQRLSDR